MYKYVEVQAFELPRLLLCLQARYKEGDTFDTAVETVLLQETIPLDDEGREVLQTLSCAVACMCSDSTWERTLGETVLKNHLAFAVCSPWPTGRLGWSFEGYVIPKGGER